MNEWIDLGKEKNQMRTDWADGHLFTTQSYFQTREPCTSTKSKTHKKLIHSCWGCGWTLKYNSEVESRVST